MKNKYNLISIKNIYIFLFSIISIIDSINGYVIYFVGKDLNIGVLYRGIIILFLCFVLITKNNIKSNIKLYFMFLYFFLIGLVHFSQLSDILINSTYVLKLFLPILIIETYRILKINDILNVLDIEKIINANCVLFPMSLLFSRIIGIGRGIYGGVGFKGLFNSTNELNIILLILFIYLYDQITRNKENRIQKVKSSILIILVIISMILMGTKTTIIGVILVIFFYTMYTKTAKQRIVTIVFVFTASFILYFIIKKFFSIEITDIMSRQNYFLNLYSKENTTYVLSGRNLYLKMAIENFYNSNNKFLLFLFGNGPSLFLKQLGSVLFFANGKEIEMDLFDTFFFYGISGCLIISFYYIKIIVNIIKNTNNIRLCYSVSVFMTIGFLILAGHVLYGAMAGTVFGILVAATITTKEK